VPKLVGVRERRHQYYYDTIIRCDVMDAPNPQIQQDTSLFNGTNLGLKYWTNMQVAGVFASDETYVVLAMRCWIMFGGPYGFAWTGAAHQLVAHQLYLTLEVGDKPQFQGPCWSFPAGGGIYGMQNLGNGEPTAESLLKFAKPIPIPARQHFHVKASFYDTGATSVRTWLNSNVSYALREIKVFIDGLHTRDVL